MIDDLLVGGYLLRSYKDGTGKAHWYLHIL